VCLARADCGFNGQVFSIYGGSVGLYAGWSIAQEEWCPEGWDVDTLSAALQQLPRSVRVRTQVDLFSAATAR
jgi:hypothetical protein